ncbi:MAG: peptidoglycan-binding domain-containing protein [Candidatus Hodarchaeales archaeon]
MAQNKSIIVKRGDYGSHIIEIQKGLKASGFWPSLVPYSKNFGPTTDKCVRSYQKAKGLVVDGKVGSETLKALGVHITVHTDSSFDEKYKGVVIQGSVFPDKPIKNNVRVRLNKEIVNEYIPEMKSVMSDKPRGFQLLITIMAYKEGFRNGTRSYRTNNPGNIGNTDSGANKHNGTLKSGIMLQRDYITKIAKGKHRAYPMGKTKLIKPYFSKEIAKHSKLYGMSPYVPGYEFVFTGQLDQFVKIYATGARAGNSYLSMIISYFKANGIEINAQSKIQDIIKMR